jgi:hypothetical protein
MFCGGTKNNVDGKNKDRIIIKFIFFKAGNSIVVRGRV